ncbi:hypothetical protein IFM89_024455 [Coptis chinensis]|uniref:Uncharacterized protein n=1 Tax=Coptis chinensis TaxID=261450 RepID=A0A835HAY8_9MAGN|nr:hypothetical protein IFM89_024455 [Coptis chinensis]
MVPVFILVLGLGELQYYVVVAGLGLPFILSQIFYFIDYFLETDAEDSGHSSGNPTPRRGIPPPTAPLPAEDLTGETRPLTEAEPPLSSRHFHPLLDAEMCKTFSGMSFSSV